MMNQEMQEKAAKVLNEIKDELSNEFDGLVVSGLRLGDKESGHVLRIKEIKTGHTYLPRGTGKLYIIILDYYGSTTKSYKEHKDGSWNKSLLNSIKNQIRWNRAQYKKMHNMNTAIKKAKAVLELRGIQHSSILKAKALHLGSDEYAPGILVAFDINVDQLPRVINFLADLGTIGI